MGSPSPGPSDSIVILGRARIIIYIRELSEWIWLVIWIIELLRMPCKTDEADTTVVRRERQQQRRRRRRVATES